MSNDIMAKVGSWAFIIGIVIALIFGLWHAVTYEDSLNTKITMSETFFNTTNGGYVAWALVLIGLIVGILAVMGRGTITKSEVPGFLLAGIALVVMGGVFPNLVAVYSIQPLIGSLLVGISVSLAIFVAPAVGILAIKAVWDMGKEV